MKPIKLLVLVAFLLAPAVASAQYYSTGPSYGYGGGPGHFHHRWGRLAWGFSVGLGGMHDDGSGLASCDNCSTAVAFEADGHIGGMLSDRFALLLEGQVNGRTVHVDDNNGDTVLTQNVAMVAGQYWILPMLWVKGGIGLAGLEQDNAYVTYDYGAGVALMGAVGVELLSARFFAIDLQARLINGFYNGGSGNITAGTIGLGFNWY
ncbi:MAG TPA: hypothetical protein VGL61_18065 [Kofleriaceae bacterium]|jgi:hypothetical protein